MSIIDDVLSLIAPHKCVACQVEGNLLCRACSLTLPTLPSICYVCARATKNYQPCDKHKTSNSLLSVYIASEYAGSIKKLIKAYKFDYKRSASKDIAFFLHNSLPYIHQDTVISYVPTIGKHVRERGFDHTLHIAKQLANLQKLRYAETILRVTVATQKGANKTQRKQQLKGAFRPIEQNISKKNILLVDDVVTTGATIEECTKQLYSAGAKNVKVAVVARTP